MGQNSNRLGREKIGEVGEKTTDKSKKKARTINFGQQVLEMIDVHVFGGASLLGACTAAYTVIRQPYGTKEGLIASKSRFSKKQLTIPRLELIATQMVAN